MRRVSDERLEQACEAGGHVANLMRPSERADMALDLRDERAHSGRLAEALRRHGRHPDSCPKGVGIGVYKPPADARCKCGIDAALAEYDGRKAT